MPEEWEREPDRETDDKPHFWINRNMGAGRRAHCRVWIERDVPGFDMDRWTVRKEEIDDSGRGQHKPTTLAGRETEESARQAAVDWMRDHQVGDGGR